MKFSPYIFGSGRAAQAILQSLKIVELRNPHWEISPVQTLSRGTSLLGLEKKRDNPVLFLANPHALHAPKILEAEQAGFSMVICEKPAAVGMDQIEALKKVQIPVALLHVYRQMWGLQTLREMVLRGDLGELIAVEGRYWQSSAAVRGGVKSTSWKNEVALNGRSDTAMDVGVHWVDAAAFILGDTIKNLRLWRSYVNSEAPHRDTHVHLQMEFTNGVQSLASISKTLHGATNHFEINIIGSKKYAAWKFLEADQIEVSEGTTKSFVCRSNSVMGTGHAPFHGAGWMEGYSEIISRAFKSLEEKTEPSYPTLSQHLQILEPMLKALLS
jgi:predicted dehydrogenase